MSGISQEWVDEAEGDYHTALREYRARKEPNYDAVCFHAQQCIEKYMKALLIANKIPFHRIHDLEVLLDSCLTIDPILDTIRSETQLLTQYAVSFRYPGESADKAEAAQAVSGMENCRSALRQALSAKPTDNRSPTTDHR